MSDAPETMFVRAKPNGALGDWHDATSNETTAKISARPMVRYIRADLAAAKDARIADLERQLAEAREVKPLEWDGIGGDYAARASTGFAGVTYRADKTWDIFCLVFSVPGMELGVLGKFSTLESAKAAAQADYAARILSALKEPKP